jgi:hypothetical protein
MNFLFSAFISLALFLFRLLVFHNLNYIFNRINSILVNRICTQLIANNRLSRSNQISFMVRLIIYGEIK